MAHIASHELTGSVAPTAIDAWLDALRNALASFRGTLRTYRRQRAIYRQTLFELRSYRPHELADLRINAEDIEAIAREQAGW